MFNFSKIKTYKILAVLIAILLTFSFALFYYTAPAKNYEIVGFDYNRAYNDLVVLTGVGENRLTGTDNEKKAAEYILGEFTKAGLSNPHIEEFPATLYEVNSASLSIVEYNPLLGIPKFNGDVKNYVHKSDFTVQSYSGTKKWSSFEDDVGAVYVGNGTDPNLYKDASGKAVIATNKDAYAENAHGHTQLYIDAGLAGASLNIIQNQIIHPESDFKPISFSMGVYNSDGHMIPFPDSENYSKADYAHLPSVMVSNRVGGEIRDKVISGTYKIRFSIDVTIEKRNVRVVVGDVKGKNDKFIIIGAHHDSVYVGKGAMDDGSGTVAVIELARQLSKYKPDKTIRLATWGGEEEGLLGSYEYFKAHKEEIKKNMLYNFNMDQTHVNLSRDNRLWITTSNDNINKDLTNIRDILQKNEPTLKKYNVGITTNRDVRGVDYETFMVEGIEGSTAGGSGSWEYHTDGDTVDKINAESLQVTARIYGSYALWPARQ
jgi:hypothetical protein